MLPPLIEQPHLSLSLFGRKYLQRTRADRKPKINNQYLDEGLEVRGHGSGLVQGLHQLQAGRERVLHERVVRLEVGHLRAGRQADR